MLYFVFAVPYSIFPNYVSICALLFLCCSILASIAMLFSSVRLYALFYIFYRTLFMLLFASPHSILPYSFAAPCFYTILPNYIFRLSPAQHHSTLKISALLMLLSSSHTTSRTAQRVFGILFIMLML
jgi:hypothetical protein